MIFHRSPTFHHIPAVIIAVLVFSCCHRNEKDIMAVSFPNPPVEIMTNEDVGMRLINYLNIIQLPQGIYRMYFSAFEDGLNGSDWNQNLYWAESADGFSYEFKGRIMDSIVEQTVFMVEDKEYPFRMVGNILVDGKHNMCLWKSRDGLAFTDKKVLFTEMHDTQNVMIERDGRLRLYTRIYQEKWANRKNVVADFSLDGEQLTDLQVLPGDFLYNSAASKADAKYDILFPTYYNKQGGNNDSIFLKTFVTDGLYEKEIPCGLNKWIEPDELWVIVAPGFITIGGKLYLAFNTRTRSHDADRAGVVSKYKLIEVVIE